METFLLVGVREEHFLLTRKINVIVSLHCVQLVLRRRNIRVQQLLKSAVLEILMLHFDENEFLVNMKKTIGPSIF